MAQNNTAFSSIKIDTGARQRARFNLSHDVNTTAGFGDCQPAQVKFCIPNTKSVCSFESLIRLAPMVAPTYGDMKLKVWHHFVGMSDLLRGFTKFLVEEPYGTANGIKKMTSLPKMRLNHLSAMCLIGCHCTFYVYDKDASGEGAPDVPDQNDFRRSAWRLYSVNPSPAQPLVLSNALVQQDFISQVEHEDARFPGYVGTMVSPSLFEATLPTNKIPVNNVLGQISGQNLIFDGFDSVQNVDGTDRYLAVTLQSADHVFIRAIQINGNTNYIAIAVRLSSFGKRLRKILIASGYQMNFTSNAYVNILPLMAYYKAYFDTFGLCLYQNYESTNADVLLKQYDAGTNNFDWGNTEFCRFITDLGNTFVTDEQDFVSAHMRSDAVSTDSDGFINNIVLDPNYNGQQLVQNLDQANNGGNEYENVEYVTKHVFIDRVNHSEVAAELLKKLYKWTNRNTIAGRRLAELLRAAGFGKYVDEQKTNFIGYSEVRVNVSDVNATADSFNTDEGTGSILGQYTGKGVGYDEKAANKTFTFENDEHGYWVTIMAMVPNSGYAQGVDQTLYDTDRFDIYTPEFDGLGMELSRKSLVVGSVDWENAVVDGRVAFDESFGLVPRYSRYKVASNILNGDFSLRGQRDAYLPYTLDKFIEVGNRRVVEDESDEGTGRLFVAYKGEDYDKLPIAGNAWRYNSRYPWLNNFERIFAVYLKDYGAISNALGIDLNHYEYEYNVYDQFIVQSRLKLTQYAPMLPIEDSYGTTDENDGHGDAKFGKA